MGTLIGFAVGYLLGTRAGQDGLAQLTVATQEVLASAELRELLARGTAVAGAVLGETLRRQAPLVGQLAQALAGGSGPGAPALAHQAA